VSTTDLGIKNNNTKKHIKATIEDKKE